MPKSSNQKLKLIYLIKIMLARTDEEHSLTMPQIIEALEAYDITAERKSIYSDFEILRSLGIDIIGEKKGKTYYYYVGKRDFEVAELKLLVDAIQSSRFITAKKSNELIKKLEGLTSDYQAKSLHRQVFVAGRVKTMNESIYYNVDEIHSAIALNRKIKFKYYKWNEQKNMELRHDGSFYYVSPWALLWDSENYYLIAYDSTAEMIKHYRVDKMVQIQSINAVREGRELFTKIDMVAYNQKHFGMYGGNECNVRLQFTNELANVVIDRFGKDLIFFPADEKHFIINVKIAISDQFFAWIFGLGNGVKILGPENVVNSMCEKLNSIITEYQRE